MIVWRQRRSFLVGLAVFFCTQTAWGADLFDNLYRKTGNEPLFNLGAGLGVSGMYDSNIFKTQFNETDDFYFSVDPRVDLGLHYGALSANLVYQPHFLFLAKNQSSTGIDTILQDLRFSSVLFSTTYFRFVLDEELSSTQTFYQSPGTPDNVSLRNRVRPQAIVHYELDPLTALDVVGEFERTDVQTPGEDFYGYGGSLRLIRELHPLLGIFGGGGVMRSIYDSAYVGEAFNANAEGGIRFDLWQRLHGNASVHYDWLFIQGPGDTENLGFSGEITTQITDITSFSAKADYDLGLDLTGHVVKNLTFHGSLIHELGPRTTFEASAYHSILDIPFFSPVNDRIWGTRAKLEYDIMENLRAAAHYEFDQNLGPTFFNDFVDHRGIISLAYDFGTLIAIQ